MATNTPSTTGRQNTLRIMAWNIRGVETNRQKKLKDWAVRCYIQDHGIVGLTETHTHPLSDINMEGYTVYHNPRRQDMSLTNRASWGVAVLIRDELIKYIKHVQLDIKDSAWMRVEGTAKGPNS